MTDPNIFGCFTSFYHPAVDAEQTVRDLAKQRQALFEDYIWGEQGFCNALKKLNYEDYGKDLVLILFEFQVNPPSEVLPHFKKIGNYRSKEKSIGIPVIVNEENFFSRTEIERLHFFRNTLEKKVELLIPIIKRRKLDTAISKLRNDLCAVLDNTTASTDLV
jgi:hypothetical protein